MGAIEYWMLGSLTGVFVHSLIQQNQIILAFVIGFLSMGIVFYFKVIKQEKT